MSLARAAAEAKLTRTALTVALVGLLLSPISVDADWVFTPNIARTFGADTFGRSHATYGAAISWIDEEAFGWEFDVNYAPDFFEGEHEQFTFTGDSHVATVMTNAMVSLLPSDNGLRGFDPYVSAGIGLMQMRAVTPNGSEGLFESLVHEFGWNAGVGAIGFVTDHVGIRGDVRYLRSFQNGIPSWTRGIEVDVAPGNFDFWRAGIGATFRWGE
jgi:opacity protein-like surface antigen